MFDHDLSGYQKEDLNGAPGATESGSLIYESEKVIKATSQLPSWECESGVCVLSWKPTKIDSKKSRDV